MAQVAGKFLNFIRNPIVTGLGQGALAAGMSAYNSAANEDYRNEGDQRIIAKAVAAGLMAGLGSGAMRFAAQKYGRPLADKGLAVASKQAPELTKSLTDMYQANAATNRIPILPVAEGLGVTAIASMLGGIGANTVGDAVADAAGVAQNTGMPIGGSWTNRANEWNWDKETAKQQAIAEYQRAVNDQLLAGLSMQTVAYPLS